jgi:hypothetical protein
VEKDGMQALALSSGDLANDRTGKGVRQVYDHARDDLMNAANDSEGKDEMQALVRNLVDRKNGANEGAQQAYAHARDDPMNAASAQVDQAEMLKSAHVLDPQMNVANDQLKKAKNRDNARGRINAMNDANVQELESARAPGVHPVTGHRADHDLQAEQAVSARPPGERVRAVENHLPGQSDRAGSEGSGDRSD